MLVGVLWLTWCTNSFLSMILKPNVSVLMLHWTPSTLSFSVAFSERSRSVADVAFSDSGRESITFLELNIHLVSRKPSFDSNWRSWLTKGAATASLGTNRRQSYQCRDSLHTFHWNCIIFFSIIASSFLYRITAQLAQLGNEAPLNKWTNIWYSLGSFSRSPSGHQRNHSCNHWAELEFERTSLLSVHECNWFFLK